MTGELVVTVHDISPRNLSACRTVVSSLAERGLSRLGLLVIPADPEGPLTPDGETAEWLRELAAAGHEVILHGYYHRRLPADALALWPALADRLVARGVGEFVALDAAEATDRLTKGRAALAAAGLPTEGFIAPAWLHSRATRGALRAAGFRYYTSHAALHDLARSQTFGSFTLCNRPGSAWGDWSARRVNELLLACQGRRPLLRVAVHPADVGPGRPFAHTLGLLDELLRRGRQSMTYSEYLERAG